MRTEGQAKITEMTIDGIRVSRWHYAATSNRHTGGVNGAHDQYFWAQRGENHKFDLRENAADGILWIGLDSTGCHERRLVLRGINSIHAAVAYVAAEVRE